MINVFLDGDGFQIWTDTEAGHQDGRCLGVGDTLRAALKDAKDELNHDLDQLAKVEDAVRNHHPFPIKTP